MPNVQPVALVTGASGGMGGAIVRDLAETHRVIAVGRNAQVLDELASATGAEVWLLDVTDAESFEQRVGELDRLDVLVHAAAVYRKRPVAEASPYDWEEHLAVNATAPALLTRVSLPLLRETQGTVVFLGSGVSTRPAPANAVYTASKHALKGIADVLRIDEEPYRVRVVTIAPGQTDTEMLRAMTPADEYDPTQYIQPASIAHTVRFVVDAPADVQLTDIIVRPRQEVHRL